MSILNDIDKKINLWGKSPKVKEPSEIEDLLNQINAIKSHKNDYYIEIGKAYYKENQGNDDFDNNKFLDFVKYYFDEIHKVDVMIKEKKKQINLIKGIVCCEKCGAEIPSNSFFCNNCGAKIETEAKEIVNIKKCAQCGSEIKEGDIFCANCGTKVETEESNSTVRKLNNVCPNCGIELSEGQKFCIECGYQLN